MQPSVVLTVLALLAGAFAAGCHNKRCTLTGKTMFHSKILKCKFYHLSATFNFYI